jgi:hypothetical protein
MAASCPLAFWARGQAHETAMHRADAARAGVTVTGNPGLLQSWQSGARVRWG